MNRSQSLLRLLTGALLLGIAASTAWSYVLLSPYHKWGDPDEPVEYRLNTSRNEASIPGDAEFNDLRNSFLVWQNQGTRLAFYEGPTHTNCNFADNGLNELAFDECGGQCTGNCLAVTRSITDVAADLMWQEGPDGTIKCLAKYDADILFNASVNFWSPSEGACVGSQFSVIGVAVHEIGHLLGLGHSPVPDATMEATIAPCSHIEEDLAADDIAGLRQLYSTASEPFVYANQTNGVIGFTVNNAASFGYTGQGGRWGRSFEAPIGTTNLFEGGLALGTPAGAQLSDDFRIQGLGQDADFIQQTGITVINHTDPLQVTSTQYDDSRAEAPYGVHVTQRSFIFPAGPDEDFTILQYRIRNDSGAAIQDLHVGLFTDWDLQGVYATNTVSYDADLSLGWVSDPSTAFQTGICVLNPEGATSYRALYATNTAPEEIYTEANKKSWFFSGFARTEIINNDIGMMIVTGPFDLAPGGTATAAFAIISGADHNDLRANCQEADAKYPAIQYFPDNPTSVDGTLPVRQLRLGQNQPNPFASATRIPFEVLRPGRVEISIYDVAGRLVRELLDGYLAEERYEVVWDRNDSSGRAVPPGAYFYRLVTPDGTRERKLLVLH